MASLNKSNRLSPPLMWAFRSAASARDSRVKPVVPTDSTGQRLVAGRKGSDMASVTETMLREQVWIDLGHLLNTIALESTVHEVRGLGHVRTSILNYGLPDIAHRSIDELLGSDRVIERELETSLKTFEPRLIAGSVRVRIDKAHDTVGLKVRFIVHADLSCRPVDIPLQFTAEVESASGKFSLTRL